ncbi:MAG: hypothetical protein AAF915_19675 [Cyanobacteria bacterium P01_D01_bin.50]
MDDEMQNPTESNIFPAFDNSIDIEEPLENKDVKPANTIVSQLSDEAKLRMEVLQNLIEPCD